MENKNQTKRGILAFMLRHSQGQKRWFLLAVAAAVVSVAANFIVPQVIRIAVDSIVGSEEANLPLFLEQWLLANRNVGQKLLLSAGLALLFSVLAAVFNLASRMSMARCTETFSKTLRDKLFRHVQYLPFKWHVENQTGDIIQRCTSDLEVLRNFLSSQLLEVVRTVLLVVVALALMLSMNPLLSLVSLVFIPLIVGYSILFYRLVGTRFLAADEAEGELTVAVQENLTGVRVVRAFGRERYELERFDGYNNHFANLWIRLGRILGVYWGVGDLVTGLLICTVVIAGSVLAAGGHLSLGEFLVFVSYNQALAWPVRSLGRTLSEMSKTGVSAARIQEILDAQPEEEEPGAQKPSLHADIRFENVTFCYGSQTVLQNLSFTIPKGSTFGILGATGSGKSTITYLLNRLYDLPEGCGNIWFGDTEIRQIDRHYLRRNVGLVLQEPFLFSKTIQENISIGRKDANLRQVRHAAGIAAVDDAIREFSGGYGTVVGERGVTLSGGQKQRVAIARTLMMDAPVMVFDDSLSAVDMETDARIRGALQQNTNSATVILIGHRINTLMHAGQILVLENGRIAALGTHAQLVAQPGLYRRIYEMQNEGNASQGEGKGGEGHA
ncbi:MAG: ABC transporter ATP-binding protein [Oscillospiraceae bacterium]